MNIRSRVLEHPSKQQPTPPELPGDAAGGLGRLPAEAAILGRPVIEGS